MASCELNCGGSVQLKACGGRAPYTWTKTGENVNLSATTGASISVSKGDQNWVSGISPGVVACLQPNLQVIFTECVGACIDGFVRATLSINDAFEQFDCNGNSLGIAPQGLYDSALATSTRTGGGLFEDLTGFPRGFDTAECVAGAPTTVTITINKGITSSLAQTSVVSIPWTVGTLSADCFTPGYAIVVASKRFDLRSPAMDAAGCKSCCAEGPVTVTVTDALGVQNTVVLHA